MEDKVEESKEPEFKRERKVLKAEMIVALSAIFISVMTLFVYMYQAHIMRQQQHASVWPYLEWAMEVSVNNEMHIAVINKGVGPAIIKSNSIKLDGASIANARELLYRLMEGNMDSLSASITDIDTTVIAPGEEVHLLEIADRSGKRKFDPELYYRIQYEICYCSVYGDCWTSIRKKVVESRCD